MTRCSIYLLFLWQHPILSLVTIWFDICFIAAVSVEAPMLGWIIQLGVTVLFTVFHICLFVAWNYWNIKRFKSRYQVYYISGATSRQIVNYVMFKFNFSIIIALLFWIIVRKYNTDFIYGKYRISVTYESDSQISRIRNRDIGYVSDSYPLLPKASVLENVCLPLIYGTYSKKQKKKLGLKSLGTVDMEGCQYREAWTLTPGEKICVMLARAIVNRPRLFVGEDLLENLNRVQTDKILNVVKRMPNMGITCVLIMRDPELLEVCSRKYLLKEGKLVEYT